jgi:beta-galactosidase
MTLKPVFVLIALVFLASGSFAHARVEFSRDFAPSETWVKAPEKPLRDDICLNGSWQFQPVALPDHYREDNPAPELTPPKDDGWEKIPLKVPSPWNVNTFADQDGQGGDFHCYPSYPKAWQDVKMGWIRRNFTVPAEWKGRRVLIHIAAAAGDLQFQINGKDAGKQFDMFFPFDLDVTDLVQYGASNEILVGIRKASLFNVQGKYGRRTYQGGSFWGEHAVGIWQDIDLVAVPVVRVSDVFVQPVVDQDALKAQVTLHNDNETSIQVDVSGAVYPWINQADKDGVGAPEPKWKLGDAAALSLPASAVTIPAHGEQTVTIGQKVGGALKFWSPDDPTLYGLLVNVKTGGQVVDVKYTRFGWRQITLSDSQVLLNGNPIVLKGDSWHFLGIPQMTRRYPWAWFSALHDANLNAVRLHAQPYPEFYLDVADEMGIMVLDETATWASDGGPKLDSDVFWKDTESHIEHLIVRDRGHPSVFGWSVCNEVRPIVQNVFHNPPGMYDKLLEYYSIWADTCHRLDPTRQWISADGDDDGGGKLPTFMVHYGDASTMEHASKVGKPWGVGEASGAYYMTPEEVAKTYGEHAYDSFQGRMEGIAVETYKHLVNQRKYKAGYRSVFNLVWYGLQPLPLGLADTTKPPTLDDGVFFPPYVEDKPGVQPERLGPYCTTLNPGYDPGLPPYKTWALFDAIKDAQAEPPVDFPLSNPPNPSSAPTVDTPKPSEIKSLDILAGADGKLKDQLSAIGVPFDDLKPSGTPDLLFIDGSAPPDADARQTMDAVLGSGGTVVVWGVAPNTLSKLNALLPNPLELTDRKSSSLVADAADPVTAGIKSSDMYFSELSPNIILDGGLGGPLVEQSSVLLKACNTDWLKWNKQAEFAKTAMVVRSENEAKPSGAALISVKEDKGQLFICNLPAASQVFKVQKLDRQILQNLGVPLKQPVDVGEPFLKTGQLVRTLACGRFESGGDNAEKDFVDPAKGNDMRDDNEVKNKRWHMASADKGVFDLRKSPLDGPGDNAVVYLSFWVMSSRSLDNLLLEPNVPKLDLELQTDDAFEFWLNGKSVLKNPATAASGPVQAEGLPLQQGWNHFLIRVLHDKGDDKFEAKLICSQPEFFHDLKSAVQKP